MQQLFNTRNYSVRDFEEWQQRDELILQPKFQRREVWSEKARSYLIDTIIRGKPIPKIYMRQDVNPKTRRVVREIVDGQQRLHSVLNFLKDGFKISRAHSDDFGGKTFSQLNEDAQRDILKYEFAVDLLQDMPDNEIYNIFARINTYSEKLKDQELRNSKWYGDFKSSVYLLAEEFTTFFVENKLFTAKTILRMAEAEFISDLLLSVHEGIVARSKAVLDNAYKKYDDDFPSRKTYEKRFRETMDIIKAIHGNDLAESEFRAQRLFYPMFCSIYHLKFGLPHFTVPRKTVRVADYPKMKTALESIDALLEEIKESHTNPAALALSNVDSKFYESITVHFVHADKRLISAQYICRKLTRVLG
jgi:Protein of unknown function DUF262